MCERVHATTSRVVYSHSMRQNDGSPNDVINTNLLFPLRAMIVLLNNHIDATFACVQIRLTRRIKVEHSIRN